MADGACDGKSSLDVVAVNSSSTSVTETAAADQLKPSASKLILFYLNSEYRRNFTKPVSVVL
jgi:hypothetical protein